ncbi:MAG TPA: vWA domain-containing protein [Polyangiales bacterium]|nr:vWA domain-containing protein [Polyangiales bacterium]
MSRASLTKLGVLALLLALAGCSADSGSGSGSHGNGNGAGSGGTSGSAAVSGSGGESGSTGGAGTSGGTAGSDGPDVNAILAGGCAKATVASALLPSNILFVIDRSGSMACNLPPITDSAACEKDPKRANPSEPSKWEITSDALLAAIKTLPANATVAISYFSNDDNCGVHPTPSVPFAPNNLAQQSTIDASLRSIKPAGGTPLVGATILAYEHMHQQALAGAIFGNEFVVLLTDGQQSEQCSDTSRCTGAAECTDLLVNTEVPKAAGPGVGIRTFVVGVPGSEPARTVLSEIAMKGGTAKAGCDPTQGNCHFDMSKETDLGPALSAALKEIAGQTVTCELPLPEPAMGKLDLTLVNVIYSPSTQGSPKLVPQDKTKACDGGANGWQYTEDNTKIRLCGPICDTVRGDAGGRVDVVLGCPVHGPE